MTDGRTYHHGDLREAVLDAATDIIERDGVAGLSMKAVADATGVATSATYHHFENKAALLAAVGRRALDELREQLAAAGPDLAAMGLAYLQYAMGHPGLFRLMFQASIRAGRYGREVDASGDSLHELLRSAVAASVSPSTDVDGATIAIWSSTHGLATLLIDGPLDASATTDGFLRAQMELHIGAITR